MDYLDDFDSTPITISGLKDLLKDLLKGTLFFITYLTLFAFAALLVISPFVLLSLF